MANNISDITKTVQGIMDGLASAIGKTSRSPINAKPGGASRRVMPVSSNSTGGSRRETESIKATPSSAYDNIGEDPRTRIHSKKDSKVSEADEAADDLDDFNDGQGEGEGEGNENENLITDSEDQFLADFNAYSRDHLNGMGLYDFLSVDPNSQSDREMWEAFWNDPTMGRYYGEQKQEYGDFDAYWNAMMANTIDEIMGNMDLERQYFNNTGGDSMYQIMMGLAHDGFIPTSSGDRWQQDEMDRMYTDNPDLAALTMMYQYGYSAAQDPESGLDLETDPLAVAKLNDYLQLGNMQFGTGDGYDTEVGDLPDDEFSNFVDPTAYQTSVEKGYSSIPGAGLPVLGIRSIMNDRYGVGYQLRPGVEDLYAEYSSSDDDGGE